MFCANFRSSLDISRIVEFFYSRLATGFMSLQLRGNYPQKPNQPTHSTLNQPRNPDQTGASFIIISSSIEGSCSSSPEPSTSSLFLKLCPPDGPLSSFLQPFPSFSKTLPRLLQNHVIVCPIGGQTDASLLRVHDDCAHQPAGLERKPTS